MESTYFPLAGASRSREFVTFTPPIITVFGASITSATLTSFSQCLTDTIAEGVSQGVSERLLLTNPSIPVTESVFHFGVSSVKTVPLTGFEFRTKLIVARV